MLWQYKLEKNFDLIFEENRSLLFLMTANLCQDMLQNVDEIIGWPFPVIGV